MNCDPGMFGNLVEIAFLRHKRSQMVQLMKQAKTIGDLRVVSAKLRGCDWLYLMGIQADQSSIGFFEPSNRDMINDG